MSNIYLREANIDKSSIGIEINRGSGSRNMMPSSWVILPSVYEESP